MTKETTERPIGTWVRRTAVFLCLVLAVALPWGMDTLFTAAEGLFSSLLALANSVGILLLLATAARLWPESSRAEGPFFETAALLFPVINRFRRVVRSNAELETRFSGVLRAYGLVNQGKDPREMVHKARKKARQPFPRAIAHQLMLDPNFELSFTTAERQQLPRCLEILYADRHGPPGACDWNPDEKAHLYPVLAKLVIQHDLFTGSGEVYEIGEVISALDSFPRFSLEAVFGHLRQAPKVVVDNMAKVLEAYGLGALDSSQRREIQGRLTGLPLDMVVPRCATEFAERLAGGPGDASRKARLIELLYCDRYRLITKTLWSRHKPQLIEDLTRDLCGKGPLADWPRPFENDGEASETSVRLILDAMEDFNLYLAADAANRLAELRRLTEHYAGHLGQNGIAAEASLSDLLGLVRERLPKTRSDQRLKARRVDLELLRKLGENWLEAQTPEATDGERRALSIVLAGSYLTRVSPRPDLATDLARHAGLAKDKDLVSDMLLALMWQHQSRGGQGSVSLGELTRRWPDWLKQARDDRGQRLADEMTRAMRADLRRGVWPTKLPIEQAIVGLTDRVEMILELMHKMKDDRLAPVDREELQRLGLLADKTDDVKQALKDAFGKVQREISRARDGYEDQMAEKIRFFVDEILKVRDPGEPKLESFLHEARKSVEEASATQIVELTQRLDTLANANQGLVDGLGKLTDADHELAYGVSALEATDHDLACEVGALKATDSKLVDEVGALKVADLKLANDLRLMLEQDTAHTRRYMVTFGSNAGSMAELLKALKQEPFNYELGPYTPFARVGQLSPGESFDDFCTRFWRDLREVHGSSQAKPKPDLEKAKLAVQLIAKPRGENVPVLTES